MTEISMELSSEALIVMDDNLNQALSLSRQSLVADPSSAYAWAVGGRILMKSEKNKRIVFLIIINFFWVGMLYNGLCRTSWLVFEKIKLTVYSKEIADFLVNFGFAARKICDFPPMIQELKLRKPPNPAMRFCTVL